MSVLFQRFSQQRSSIVFFIAVAFVAVFFSPPSQSQTSFAQWSAQRKQAQANQEAVDEVFTAVKRDNRSSVLGLIKEGANVNVIDPQSGQTPMTLAFQIDSMNAFNALMTSPQTNADFANRFGETPLMLAAIRGNKDAVERLIRVGAQINRQGWSPLHYAASGTSDAQVEIAKLLLAKGANINARSPNGTTPLMMAAGNGSAQMVQFLLESGADATLVNDQNLDAKDFAKNSGRQPLVDRIQRYAPQPKSSGSW